MKSPWTTMRALEPDREYLAFASWIPARRYGATPRLFRGASAVREQLATTPGLIGFSLLARPVRKQYATLSLWESDEALAAFSRSEPHGRLLAELAPEMGDTNFIRWTIRGTEGRPTWREALRRLR